MKLTTLFFSAFILIVVNSCTTKDEKFCRCLALGKELNEASSKAMQGELSEKQAEKVRSLAKRQKQECTAYHQLDGERLKELKNGCGER